MKKLISLIVSVFALVSVASALEVTADAAYKTKVLSNGTVIFENAVVAGLQAEVSGFVVGVNTFSPIEAKTTQALVGKAVVDQTASSGLFKRVDAILGYKFTAPLANLTIGADYETYSKSAQLNGFSSNTELFARLDGKVTGTLLTWDATTTLDTKNHVNNVEANVRLPFGFKWVKIAPAIGYGFNDPGATTIAAYKNAKRYALVGVGIGYYSKKTVVAAEYYQRRDTFTAAGGVVDGVSFGVSVKL